MALKTDYKDYIPPAGGRVYRPEYLTDGTMRLADVTPYQQEGDTLGAAELNFINSCLANMGYNLLDNSNFLRPVNQHYTIKATGNGYVAIDRWTHATSAVITEIVDTGWKIYGGDATYGAPVVQKTVHDPTKVYTLSVCTNEGVIYSVTGKASDNPKTATPFGQIGITTYGGLLSVQFTVSFGKSVILRWAQLVEGAISTPYHPKEYAVELAECQRYYRDMVVSAVKTQGNFYSLSQTINMRANPTYTLAAFSPYGAGNISNFAGCTVEVTKEFLTYAVLPTCTAYNAGGVRILLDANL